MATRFCLFLLIVATSQRLALEERRLLVIWNVGQGQWVTISDESGCWHFDVGGEFAPWQQLMNLCRARKNFFSFSHWDWDHIGLVGRARNFLPDHCLLLPPHGSTNPRKAKLMSNIKACQEQAPFTFWNGPSQKTANASSRVILWRSVLLPGDSSRDQEKNWIKEMRGAAQARILLLGHHGSATSTGKELLRNLTGVRLAIASARFRRYGHPHPRVERDLSKKQIPLLRTEDWGSIHLAL